MHLTASEFGLNSSTGKQLFNVSVVVPVFNSAITLPKLYSEVWSVLSKCSNHSEIIFVNDGSQDNSWNQLLKLAESERNVQLINLMRNYGQHNALLCGIRKAQYDVVVTLDDDLQHPAEEIPRLLSKLEQGYDLVYGVPFQAEHSIFRTWCSKLVKLFLQKSFGAKTARDISAFRAFRRRIVESFEGYSSPQTNIDVLLTWGTNNVHSLPTLHRPRTAGQSNYNFVKLLTHTLNMITGFSVLPLRIASFIGISGVVFGLVLFAYVIGRFILQGSPVPGFPFLASIIILFSGAQLLGLGIIGEYLARMYLRTMGQPAYIIHTEISKKN